MLLIENIICNEPHSYHKKKHFTIIYMLFETKQCIYENRNSVNPRNLLHMKRIFKRYTIIENIGMRKIQLKINAILYVAPCAG